MSAGARDELATRLEAAAGELTERVLRETYVDPFWRDRFGARADTHGRKDGHFHIQYLAEALRSDDPGVLERYARWLQPLLTARGMCSAHLAENFDRLAAAIAERPDTAPAVAMLGAATRALRYPGGPARAVQELEVAPALATYASYLADALAMGSAAQLIGYAVWHAGYEARHAGDPDLPAQRLTALRRATSSVPGASVAIAAALDALASRA